MIISWHRDNQNFNSFMKIEVCRWFSSDFPVENTHWRTQTSCFLLTKEKFSWFNYLYECSKSFLKNDWSCVFILTFWLTNLFSGNEIHLCIPISSIAFQIFWFLVKITTKVLLLSPREWENWYPEEIHFLTHNCQLGKNIPFSDSNIWST